MSIKTNRMKIEAHKLLGELIAKTEKISRTVRGYRELSVEQLNFRPTQESWSVLECLEHLNLYGDYYLVEMESRILAAKQVSDPGLFKSGVIGNYFAQLMIPTEKGMKKMKSPKDKDPAKLSGISKGSDLSVATIERFLKQQEHLMRLLNQAAGIDLTKTKTAISLSPLIRLRLGDTFRFYTYHIERHIAQAQRLL